MEATVKTPTHLWIVGGLSLLWNAFGGFDYLMTTTRNQAYLAQFTEAQRVYFESFPAWMIAAWACGVWGALLGSVLLLMRSRYAVWAFALSLIGLFLTTLASFVVIPAPADLKTPGMMLMNLVIWAIEIVLFVYAWRMQKKGVLR